jgi:hypothetical protein
VRDLEVAKDAEEDTEVLDGGISPPESVVDAYRIGNPTE